MITTLEKKGAFYFRGQFSIADGGHYYIADNNVGNLNHHSCAKAVQS